MKTSEILRTAEAVINEPGMDAADAEANWTKDDVVRALDRAGISLEHDYELDFILGLVIGRPALEGPLGKAIGEYLETSGFKSPAQAAGQLNCTLEQLFARIAREAGLTGDRH